MSGGSAYFNLIQELEVFMDNLTQLCSIFILPFGPGDVRFLRGGDRLERQCRLGNKAAIFRRNVNNIALPRISSCPCGHCKRKRHLRNNAGKYHATKDGMQLNAAVLASTEKLVHMLTRLISLFLIPHDVLVKRTQFLPVCRVVRRDWLFCAPVWS